VRTLPIQVLGLGFATRRLQDGYRAPVAGKAQGAASHPKSRSSNVYGGVAGAVSPSRGNRLPEMCIVTGERMCANKRANYSALPNPKELFQC
jgi:hypothetical protein